jgi:hypothetical protein
MDKSKHILKNKLTSRIGGKGSQRRKKKNIRKKISDKHKEILKSKINDINKKILSLNKVNYLKLREFIDGLINDYINDLQRADVNNNDNFNYSNIKKYGSGFIYKNFFYPINDEKILLKTDIYLFLKQNFRKSGQDLFQKFIDSIDQILIKKEYDINLENEKYDEELFNRALNFFGLNTEKKIHFKDIRTKYREFVDSTVTDEQGNDLYDKDCCHKYFSILSKQYNDYLKSN